MDDVFQAPGNDASPLYIVLIVSRPGLFNQQIANCKLLSTFREQQHAVGWPEQDGSIEVPGEIQCEAIAAKAWAAAIDRPRGLREP
jgi:hypothetical protein